MAAHELCAKLAPYRKQHHLQATVGHYGVFNGKRWERQIYPRLRDFIHAFDECRAGGARLRRPRPLGLDVRCRIRLRMRAA